MARFQRGAQDASALNHPHRAIYAWPASGWGCPSSPQQLVTFVCISDRQVPIDSHFGRMILTDIPDMETTSTSREAARRSTRIRAQIPVRITVIEGSSYFSQSCHTLVVNTAGCAVRLSQPLELATAVCIDQLPNLFLARNVRLNRAGRAGEYLGNSPRPGGLGHGKRSGSGRDYRNQCFCPNEKGRMALSAVFPSRRVSSR